MNRESFFSPIFFLFSFFLSFSFIFFKYIAQAVAHRFCHLSLFHTSVTTAAADWRVLLTSFFSFHFSFFLFLSPTFSSFFPSFFFLFVCAMRPSAFVFHKSLVCAREKLCTKFEKKEKKKLFSNWNIKSGRKLVDETGTQRYRPAEKKKPVSSFWLQLQKEQRQESTWQFPFEKRNSATKLFLYIKAHSHSNGTKIQKKKKFAQQQERDI